MTREEAGKLLFIVVSAMPNMAKIDMIPTAKAWELLMPDITYDEGKMAIVRILREKEIPTIPLPSEIIKIVRDINGKVQKTKPPTDIEAWQEVKKKLDPSSLITWSSPFIEKAVKSLGRRYLLETKEEMAQARFTTAYREIIKQNVAEEENKKAFEIVFNNANFLKQLSEKKKEKEQKQIEGRADEEN